jgi:hypothetical protein
MTSPESGLHVEVVARDRREPARVAILRNLLQGGNVSPAARKAHHRKIRSAPPMTVSEFVARARKARQRQAARAGVDSVAFR